MSSPSSEALTERAVGMYHCLVALNAISEDSALPVGRIATSQHCPVPTREGGWANEERHAQVVASWLGTALRLGWARRCRGAGSHGGSVWRYYAVPSA